MIASLTKLQPTVFLVDDDPDSLQSLQWLLQTADLQVEAYHSAHEFLRAFDPEKSGCLVLDIRMPGMSGLELQEELRQRGCR